MTNFNFFHSIPVNAEEQGSSSSNKTYETEKGDCDSNAEVCNKGDENQGGRVHKSDENKEVEGHESNDSNEEESDVDQEYWKESLIGEYSDSDDEDHEERASEVQMPTDKRYYGSTKYEEDHSWLYYSQVHKGYMCKICEKYPYSSGRSKGAFSTRPCMNTKHPSYAFKQHEKSNRHIRLENKVNIASKESVLDSMILGAEKKTTSKIHSNNLYLRKCIQTIFFMIKKHIALTDNYGDMMQFVAKKLEEPITLQYLHTCPKMLHI